MRTIYRAYVRSENGSPIVCGNRRMTIRRQFPTNIPVHHVNDENTDANANDNPNANSDEIANHSNNPGSGINSNVPMDNINIEAINGNTSPNNDTNTSANTNSNFVDMNADTDPSTPSQSSPPSPSPSSFTETTWMEFCDRIDENLVFLTNLKTRNSRISSGLLFTFMISIFLVPMSLLRDAHTPLSRQPITLSVLCIGAIAFIATLCYLMHSAKRREDAIHQRFKSICKEFSTDDGIGIGQQLSGRNRGRGDNIDTHEENNEHAVQVLLRLKRQRIYSYGKSMGVVSYIEVKVWGGMGSRTRSRTPDTMVSMMSDDDDGNDRSHAEYINCVLQCDDDHDNDNDQSSSASLSSRTSNSNQNERTGIPSSVVGEECV